MELSRRRRLARPMDLVGLAHTTLTGVTGSLNRLEDAGPIERKPTEMDRRLLLVCFTDHGRKAVEASISEFDALAARRFGRFSDREIDMIYAFDQGNSNTSRTRRSIR